MTADKLPNTGQAVIIDIGEGQDIHPRNKQDVANRLARRALQARLRHRHRLRKPHLRRRWKSRTARSTSTSNTSAAA